VNIIKLDLFYFIDWLMTNDNNIIDTIIFTISLISVVIPFVLLILVIMWVIPFRDLDLLTVALNLIKGKNVFIKFSKIVILIVLIIIIMKVVMI